MTAYAPFFWVYITALAGIELLIGMAFAWRARAASSQKIGLLAAAYAWSLPLALLNVLLMPGVSPMASSQSLQSGPFTWILWHAGWGVLLIAYAAFRERSSRGSRFRAAAILAASLLCCAAALSLHHYVPRFVSPDERMLLQFVVAIAGSLALDLAALTILMRSPRTGRDSWVAASVACTAVESFFMLIAGERFNDAFYAARIAGILSDVSMLAAVLADAVSIVRRATVQAVDRERLNEFEMMAESMPHIVWRVDARGGNAFVNRRWTEYTGRERQGARDINWSDAIHADDRPIQQRAFELAQRSLEYEATYRIRSADGSYRHFISRASPIVENGNVTGWIGTSTDIEDQRRLEQERAAAFERQARDAGRMRLVATVGRALSQSLDVQVVLDTAVRAVIPFIADYAVINIMDSLGELIAAATHHRDPDRARELSSVVGQAFVERTGSGGSADAAANATVIYMPDKPLDRLSSAIKPEWQPLIRAMNGRSCVIVPLITNGIVRGTMTVAYAESGRQYQPDDIEVLEEIGRRVSLSIDNAEHYSREHRVADRLQEALLPSSLPNVPGVTLSAVYQAGRSEAQIGGDWFDAFVSSDGRLLIGVGDVMGSGLDAAVTMSVVRQAIRGAAEVSLDPVTILNAADRTLLADHTERLVTAFIGMLDPITGVLTYASAGHPPPCVRWSDGRIERLKASGLPLGLRSEARGEERPHAVTLHDNALLVLYTDGLTEAERNFERGEARLTEALVECSLSDGAAERILSAVLGGIPDSALHDDVAILTVGLDASRRSGKKRITCDVRDGDAVKRARHTLIETLRAQKLSEDQLFNAELVLGELLGNVAKHAPGKADIVMDSNGHGTRLSVLDRGPGLDAHVPAAADALSESGRGLFIVSNVSQNVAFKRRPGGGTEVTIDL